jgi:hypothetical protein
MTSTNNADEQSLNSFHTSKEVLNNSHSTHCHDGYCSDADDSNKLVYPKKL